MNIELIEKLDAALGTNTLLDEVLGKLDNETISEVITAIITEHGLEVA